MPDLPDKLSPIYQVAPSKLVQSDLPASTSIPQGLLLWLTFGLAGAVLFTIVYLIEGAIRPGYNAWQHAISALSLGPGGWIQQANFVVYGICILCMAFAWRKVLKGSVYAIIYPIIRGIEGLAMVMVGFFSQDPAFGYPPGPVLTTPILHGQIHIIGAYVIAGAMACGFFAIAWRFARDPRWRSWVTYSVISGLLVLVFMAFFGAGQNPQNVFAGYAGLFERLATNIEPIWEILLLARLWAGTGLVRSNT
ncbi:MAG TPA: DUF998 domain-containing protein [Ktedonobacteraceae bacterium]